MASDTEAVLAMVSRCSPMTLFHRFHGVTDGVAYTRGLFDNQLCDETLVAWRRSACVGLGTLSHDEDGIAHLGVLVEDASQRRGVGGLLVSTLVNRARVGGVHKVHADVLIEDRFIVEALRRVGPLTVSFDVGKLSVDIDVGPPAW